MRRGRSVGSRSRREAAGGMKFLGAYKTHRITLEIQNEQGCFLLQNIPVRREATQLEGAKLVRIL